MDSTPAKPTYVLCATVGESPIRAESGEGLDPTSLPLSDRLLLALGDWAEFHDAVNGDLSGDDDDSTIVDEFVGQGFKLAHRLRSELKGRAIYLVHPQTGDRIRIESSR